MDSSASDLVIYWTFLITFPQKREDEEILRQCKFPQTETANTVGNQPPEDPPSSRFTWKIDNFSTLNTKKHYSDVFVVGGVINGHFVLCQTSFLWLASGITLEFPENTNSVTNGRVIRMVSKAMEEMFCAATILFQPPALTTGKHGWVERIVRKILRVFMCE
ncbi:hypothetical protein V6N13_121104 [Hibiscus sabdariffa]